MLGSTFEYSAAFTLQVEDASAAKMCVKQAVQLFCACRAQYLAVKIFGRGWVLRMLGTDIVEKIAEKLAEAILHGKHCTRAHRPLLADAAMEVIIG